MLTKELPSSSYFTYLKKHHLLDHEFVIVKEHNIQSEKTWIFILDTTYKYYRVIAESEKGGEGRATLLFLVNKKFIRNFIKEISMQLRQNARSYFYNLSEVGCKYSKRINHSNIKNWKEQMDLYFDFCPF